MSKFIKTQGIEEFYDEQEKNARSEFTNAKRRLKNFQEKEEKLSTLPQEVNADLGALAAFGRSLKRNGFFDRRDRTKKAGFLMIS